MALHGALGTKTVGRLAAALLGALALAGCPQGPGTGSSSGAAASSAPSAPLKDGDVVKVGVVLELTGSTATFGEETRNGLDLAMKDFEGKDPWKIQLVVLDNKSEAKDTERAVQQLIEVEKVSAIIGAVASTNTKAGAKIAQESEVPMVSPGSTADDVTLRDERGKLVRAEYIARVCFIDSFQGEVCAQFAARDLARKQAAIVIDKGSDYAKGLAASFRDTWTRAGNKVVCEENYVTKEADFSAVIRKVAEKKPDVIFIPGYYNDVGPMLKQGTELWKGIPKLGGDGWDSPDLFSLAGAAALADCYVTSHYSPDDDAPVVKAFVDRYRKVYNKDPGSMSALGYDAGVFIHDAIKRAGSSDPHAIRDAINSAKDVPGVAGAITLDNLGNPRKEAVVLKIEDGKYKFRARVKPAS